MAVCFNYFLSTAFFNIAISQSSVATYLRCGGIAKYEFVANLPLSLPVKEFLGNYGREHSVLFLFDSQCISYYEQHIT